MSTTEMKNEDALNSIYLTCDESGYVSIWGLAILGGLECLRILQHMN